MAAHLPPYEEHKSYSTPTLHCHLRLGLKKHVREICWKMLLEICPPWLGLGLKPGVPIKVDPLQGRGGCTSASSNPSTKSFFGNFWANVFLQAGEERGARKGEGRGKELEEAKQPHQHLQKYLHISPGSHPSPPDPRPNINLTLPHMQPLLKECIQSPPCHPHTPSAVKFPFQGSSHPANPFLSPAVTICGTHVTTTPGELPPTASVGNITTFQKRNSSWFGGFNVVLPNWNCSLW